MEMRGPNLSNTFALFLFVLSFYRAIATLQIDQASCGPRSDMLRKSLGEVHRIGTAGSGSIDWMINHLSDPDADQYNMARIMLPLKVLFGEWIGPIDDKLEQLQHDTLNEFKGAGADRHPTSWATWYSHE